jgi:hypothetical protein
MVSTNKKIFYNVYDIIIGLNKTTKVPKSHKNGIKTKSLEFKNKISGEIIYLHYIIAYLFSFKSLIY